MKKLTILIFAVVSMSACWAPRCPMKTCHVRMEHQHKDLVTGVFAGRYLYPPKIHFLWDINKGEKIPDAVLAPKSGNRKARKKFPWERW
jgi:hypothetical protein